MRTKTREKKEVLKKQIRTQSTPKGTKPKSKSVKHKAQRVPKKQKSLQKKQVNQNPLKDAENDNQKQEKKAKPKKYLQKNYEQLSRINRSKYQKIFLLSAERTQEGQWNFLVQGTSGSQYRLQVSTHVKCSCIDFRMKQKPCKHIYFIVTQVAQNNEILDYFNNTKRISKNAYKVLDDQLIQRLKQRMKKSQQKTDKQIDLKDDKDCTICFTQMEKQTQNLEGCDTCKKYFHFECLAAWKKHNPTCPLCRGALQGGGKTNDPLGMLKDINIDV